MNEMRAERLRLEKIAEDAGWHFSTGYRAGARQDAVGSWVVPEEDLPVVWPAWLHGNQLYWHYRDASGTTHPTLDGGDGYRLALTKALEARGHVASKEGTILEILRRQKWKLLTTHTSQGYPMLPVDPSGEEDLKVATALLDGSDSLRLPIGSAWARLSRDGSFFTEIPRLEDVSIETQKSILKGLKGLDVDTTDLRERIRVKRLQSAALKLQELIRQIAAAEEE